MSQVVRVLLVGVFVALAPSVASAKWTRLTSANFTFVGDASAGQIRHVAERLERFREVLLRALPGATSTSPVPTIVVVFATDRSLDPVKPLFRGRPTDVAGYLQTGEDINFIAINGEYAETALTTIFHEYAHLLVGNTLGRVPVWLNEGFAEFYEVMQGVDNDRSVVIGRAPGHHIELLKGSTLIPIRDLLTIDQRSQVYNEGQRRGVLYAQSWALTHYLTLGNKERATQLTQFLTALRNGVDDQKAFAESFPDAASLDRELFEYVRRFAFPAVRVQFAEKVATESVRTTTIDDLQGELHVLDLQARVGREDEARAKLKALLQRRPDTGRAWATLGLLDLRARRHKDALPALERAASLDQGDAFIHASLGRALVAAISEETEPDTRQPLLEKARTVLAQAVELDANSSYAAGMLGYVELALGSDLPRSIALLEKATRLAPSRDQYRMLLAQALVRQREYERATPHLGILLATGRNADVRDDARRLLTEVANARNRVSSSSSASPTAASSPSSAASSSAPGETLRPFTSTSDLVPPRGAPRVRLDLRVVRPGESRVLGQFTAIECTGDSIALRIVGTDRTFVLSTKQLSDVDFITYRSDATGSVSCGPQPPVRALVTYRPRTGASSGGVDGQAVAIELLPDDYQPDAGVP